MLDLCVLVKFAYSFIYGGNLGPNVAKLFELFGDRFYIGIYRFEFVGMVSDDVCLCFQVFLLLSQFFFEFTEHLKDHLSN